MELLKVGLLGHGKMGLIREQEIAQIKGVQICAVSDDPLSTGRTNSQKCSDEIIADPAIDAVFICTPNYFNKRYTVAALAAGKHVFCEKPPAFSASEMHEVRDAERKSRKVLMYGFNHRQHGSVREMQALIRSGEFGRVLWLRGRYGKSVPINFYETWRAKREFAGGGILLDQGIHMLDLFLNLSGTFDKVHASVSNLYWKLDVEDNVFATLENTKTGVVASLHSTMTHWRHLFSLEVFLERGYLVLNGLKTSSNTYGDEVLAVANNRTSAPAATWEDERYYRYPSDDSWKIEVEEFFGAIRANRCVEFGNSSDALKLMELVDQIYKFRR
jgi:1,5-anhydro-D-fructose reductase (1,5-anhydro-D-mannitol-forming)